MNGREKGISLIVLVITIIVMIIIAGVIIISLTNGNVIDKAKESSFKNALAVFNEELQLWISNETLAKEGILDLTTVDADADSGTYIKDGVNQTMPDIIPSIANTKYLNILEIVDAKLLYSGIDTKEIEWAKEMGITVKGLVVIQDWSAFFASRNVAEDKPAGQTNTQYVGYDMWGVPVNLDLWNYCLITNTTYGTIGTYCLNSTESATTTGYKGVSGQAITEIIGEIPTVIYEMSSSTSKPVSSMRYTFRNCSSITAAPAMPNSITDMYGTFSSCTNLTTAPTIPNSTTNMEATFANCDSLTTAPIIPSNVVNMTKTFNSCDSLIIVPTIPSSVRKMLETFYCCTSLIIAPTILNGVTNMNYTFYGCGKLTTAPTVPSSVTSVAYAFNSCMSLQGILVINATNVITTGLCLSNTSTKLGVSLILSGTCPQLTTIYNTKSGNSNITMQ